MPVWLDPSGGAHSINITSLFVSFKWEGRFNRTCRRDARVTIIEDFSPRDEALFHNPPHYLSCSLLRDSVAKLRNSTPLPSVWIDRDFFQESNHPKQMLLSTAVFEFVVFAEYGLITYDGVSESAIVFICFVHSPRCREPACRSFEYYGRLTFSHACFRWVPSRKHMKISFNSTVMSYCSKPKKISCMYALLWRLRKHFWHRILTPSQCFACFTRTIGMLQ